MSITIKIPDFLREAADNKSEIVCNGSTVGEVLYEAVCKHPKLKTLFFDKNNQLDPFNPFVSIYRNQTHIGLLQGGETETKSGDEIHIVHIIGGG